MIQDKQRAPEPSVLCGQLAAAIVAGCRSGPGSIQVTSQRGGVVRQLGGGGTVVGSDTIGYSGLWLTEECYEYHENACYILDTREEARELMQLLYPRGRWRVDQVTLGRLMDDYGCSRGEYAMRPAAFARFKAQAGAAGVAFEFQMEQCDVPLAIVQVAGVKIHRDD